MAPPISKAQWIAASPIWLAIANGRVIRGDNRDGSLRFETPPDARVPCTALHVSVDGRFMTAGTAGGTVRLSSIDGTSQSAQWSTGSKSIVALCLDPSARRVASINAEGALFEWGVDLSPTRTPAPIVNGGVTAIAYSSDGRFLVFGTRDGRVVQRALDASGRETVHALHSRAVTSVVAASRGEFVITTSEDKTARLIGTSSGSVSEPIAGSSTALQTAAFARNDRVLLLGTFGGELWRFAIAVEEGRPTVRWLSTHTIHDEPLVNFSVNQEKLLVSSDSDVLHVREPIGGDEATFGPEGWPALGSTYHAARSNDGSRLAVVGTNHLVQVWDVKGGNRLEPCFGHSGTTTCVAFSPDATRLVSGSADGTARVFDVSTSRCVLILEGHRDGLNAVAWSPDGRRIATGCRDDVVRLFDASDGKLIHEFKGHEDDIKTVTFDAESQLLASAGDDGKIGLWSLAEGRSIKFVTAHGTSVHTVVFDPAGRWLASGSLDQSLKLWSLPALDETHVVRGFDLGINVLAVDNGGNHLLAACSDGSIRRVDLGESPRAVSVATGRLAAVWCDFANGSSDTILGAWASGRLERIDTSAGTSNRYPNWFGSQNSTRIGGLDDTTLIWHDGRSMALWNRIDERIDSFRDAPSESTWPSLVAAASALRPGGENPVAGVRDVPRLEHEMGALQGPSGAKDRVFEIRSLPVGGSAGDATFDVVSRNRTALLWDPGTGEPKCLFLIFQDGGSVLLDRAGRLHAAGAAAHVRIARIAPDSDDGR